MSNHISNYEKSYEWLTNIDSLKLENKSVLIVGGSEIVKQYVFALSKLNIRDITIISNTGNTMTTFCKNLGIKHETGGFEKNIEHMKKMDLVIIATPIQSLFSTTELAIKHGQDNILVEKPGSLYHEDLSSLSKKITTQKVRIAYNRLVYPSLYKLKALIQAEGGVSSCRFTFTELLDRIDFKKYESEIYKKWGICNSLHVISMAVDLIGLPKEIHSFQYGKLDWHPSGSIFVGSGMTQANIPFSYHADWGSGGRWGVEIVTKKNLYILMPLERLYVHNKGTSKLEEICLKTSFPDVKPGMAEEVALMLNKDVEEDIQLVSLEKAAKFNQLAEIIFGYKSINE